MLVPKQTEFVLPAIISIAFYLFVFFFAEAARKLVDLSLKKNSVLYTFLIELIGTAQMCTCVYENTIIIKHYGATGFFIIVTLLQLAAAFLNRGAFVTPLIPIEQFMRGAIDGGKLFTLLFAQTLGGYSAFRLANSLWYFSLHYSVDHHQLYEKLPCAIIHKVPFLYALLFEVIGSFLLRYALHRYPQAYRIYLAPPTFAAFLAFALVYIGVPGLNPVVASSRLQGCPGLDLQWFMMTYWCCPIIGWMAASSLDKTRKEEKQKQKKS